MRLIRKTGKIIFLKIFIFLTFVIYHIFIPKLYAEYLVVSRRLSRFIRGLTGIIARINFGFQAENFKSFSNDNFFLVCLNIVVSHHFSPFLSGWHFSIDLLLKYISFQFVIQFFGLFFRTCPAVINTMSNNTFNLLMLLLAALKYPSIEELTWSHLFELKQKVSIRARRSFLAGVG